MSETPQLSLIVAVFNGEKFLSAFFDSIKQQNLSSLELIIVNDGSTDRSAEIIARYAKLHLYDAFNILESTWVDAGGEVAPVIEIAGIKTGLMTCYDLRFPELALTLALQGAELLVLPAAWVRGPLKEHHWATLLAARALDTTCYVVAAGECGNKNIGQSRIIDPLGVTIAAAAEGPALLIAEISQQRITLARQQLPVLRNRRFAPPQLL